MKNLKGMSTESFSVDVESTKGSNVEIEEGKYIDYNMLEASYFEQWKKFLKEDAGLYDGARIGVCVSENQCIMPLILSLQDIVCEIHFLNRSLPVGYINRNKGNLNYLISDKAFEDLDAVIVACVQFFGVLLYIYRFEGMAVAKQCCCKSFFYYTSGSTGEPKTCRWTEKGIYREGQTILDEIGIKESDYILSIVPCCHKFGQSVGCVAAAMAGAKVRYMNGFQTPTSILKNIQSRKYNYVILPPMYLELICNYLDTLDIECIFISGGAPLGKKATDSALRIINIYGTTETGVIAINRENRNDHYAGKLARNVKVKCNVRCGNSENENRDTYKIEVLTPYGQEDVVTGDYVAIGDLGWLEGNDIYVSGREDDIININGLKVSGIEIEDVLRKNVAIKDAKVIKRCNDGREYAHAYVVPVNGRKIDLNELYNFCLQHLQPYKVPKIIEVAENFQYTEMGKKTMGGINL